MIKARRRKELLRKTIIYAGLILFSLFVLFPFAIMLISSFKHKEETIGSFTWWPEMGFTLQGYENAFEKVASSTSIVEGFFNTLWIIIPPTIIGLLVSTLAAYAFAKLRFRGKKVMFGLLIATMMVPGEILTIPNFVTLAKLGWIDSYKAMVAPWATSVFSIFLLRQQFASIPLSYYKAARMDGCSDLRYLFTVMIPMSRPTIVSIALLKIINSWNSYLWPLIATNSRDMRTLPVGLAYFSTEAGTDYNTLMAFSLMIIAPTVIVYLFTQKYIIQGVSKTGLKG